MPFDRDLTLHLVRENPYENTTLGKLFIDGQFKWFTLEDQWRPNQPKVPGETCIPAGKYQIVIDLSARFGRMLPHILNVPDFTGVRIHAGNTNVDTAGCILVGGSCQPKTDPPRIGESAVALQAVQHEIAQTLAAGFKVWIEIIDPETGTTVESAKEGEAAPAGTPVSPLVLPGTPGQGSTVH